MDVCIIVIQQTRDTYTINFYQHFNAEHNMSCSVPAVAANNSSFYVTVQY